MLASRNRQAPRGPRGRRGRGGAARIAFGILLGILLGGLLLAAGARAQVSGAWSASSLKDARDLLHQLERKRAGVTMAGATVPLEAAIDPAGYRLSPGDALALSIWGAAELMLDLTVTSDGQLLIPSVGVVGVAGATLAEATETVRARCAVPYARSQITLALVRPALLRIPVTGLVPFPGVCEAASTSRVSDLVDLAGGCRAGADRRAIRVRHADGSAELCDLLAWEVRAEASQNPMLRAGDRIHVAAAEQFCRVRGAPDAAAFAGAAAGGGDASAAQLIPYRPGDTVEFALLAAGWIGPYFCADGVWLLRGGDAGATRTSPEDAASRVRIPLAELASAELEPGDVIDVPFCRQWITVGGSVIKPGIYPYLAGQTVADYVYLAGGPNQRGSHSGWKLLDARGMRRGAAAADTVAPGAEIWVEERQSHTLATVLAPIASAVALIVSIVALVQ